MKPRTATTHPSLARLYQCKPQNNFLYFDETYTAPEDPYHESSFYALTAVQFRFEEHIRIRHDMESIVGSSYFHSTEALQTSQGHNIFEELIKYFSEYRDPSFITCNVNLSSKYKVEDARRECIKRLIHTSAQEVPDLAGLIFEARRENKDNNRDRRFLKYLRDTRQMPNHLNAAWVSPRDEKLLWAPDVVCMAYRRIRTHQDRTSQYFSKYLEAITAVHEFSLNT